MEVVLCGRTAVRGWSHQRADSDTMRFSAKWAESTCFSKLFGRLLKVRRRRVAVGLRYNVAYHLHCQLTLRSGRTITMEALDQELAYAGLLEGVPDARSNDWYIESSLRA